jgi:hypothetical protein
LETALYAPVKRFLEGLGLEVKGEVRDCDIVALDNGEPVAVVVCELKVAFTLELLLQGVDRTAACDEVWLAVRASKRGRGRENDSRVKKLCRMLGFGLLVVFASGRVEAFVEPVPWKPRNDAKRRSRIVEEHRRRRGASSRQSPSPEPLPAAPRPRPPKLPAAPITPPAASSGRPPAQPSSLTRLPKRAAPRGVACLTAALLLPARRAAPCCRSGGSGGSRCPRWCRTR